MSVPANSNLIAGTQNLNEREEPPRPPNGSGDGQGQQPDGSLQINSKKRKRLPEEDMGFSSASSDQIGKVVDEFSLEEISTEPELKCRRLEPLDRYQLNALRLQLSEVLVKGDLEELKRALAAYPACLNEKHREYEATLLLEAIWLKQYDMAYWLLEQGADPNIAGQGVSEDDFLDDDSGVLKSFHERWLPLSENEQQRVKLASYILGRTPLVHAASHGMTDWVQHLISRNAVINDTDDDTTPLMGAVAAGDVRMISLLLRFGADPMVEPDDGDLANQTAGSIALQLGSADIFSLLIEHVPEEKKIDFTKKSVELLMESVSAEDLSRIAEIIPGYFSMVREARTESG